MDITTSTTTVGTTAPATGKLSPAAKRTLLIFSCILYTIGACGGPLLTRLYFMHGGNRLWLTSLTQTGGFPITAVIIIILYFHRHASTTNTTFVYMRPRLFILAAFVGLLTGVTNYLYSYGFARLPVSTSSLIISAQLAFMALFAFILVKQKFTPYSINAIVLLTIGEGVLAMHASGDRPAGESKKDYFIGFGMTLMAAVLIGFLMPFIELSYKKANQAITFTLVLEFQLVLCFFASMFSLVGMIVNNDFKEIPREAVEFELQKNKYYTILCFTSLVWQCSFMGALGIIFCASSLLSGILTSVLLSITEVLAVVFYKERFQIEKGVSLLLSLWGFTSYFYGEYKLIKKSRDITHASEHSIDLTQTNYSSM